MTLRARLPVLAALCVTPINLYAPPSSLPFLCSIIDTEEELGGRGCRRTGERRRRAFAGIISTVTLEPAEVLSANCWENNKNGHYSLYRWLNHET